MPRAVIAWKMPDGLHRQTAQALHQAAAIVGIGAIGVRNQRAVTDDVARDHRVGRRLPERNAASQMPGRVDEPKDPVARIEEIAIIERRRLAGAGRWA
ncbi:MAG: hypothetical protein AAGD12_10125 [Pseudomonadota bacterium]